MQPYLEIFKSNSLKLSRGDYEAIITLNQDCIQDLTWWLENVGQVYKSIYDPAFDIEIYSDSSLLGWGGVYNGVSTGGLWDSIDRENT